MFEPKPGNFSLFRNTKKEGPNHPDYNFRIIFDQDLIDNLQKQLNEGKTPTLYGGGWVKQRDGDSSFISGIAKVPYEAQPATEDQVEEALTETPIVSEEQETAPETEAETPTPEEETPEPQDDLPF